MNNYQLLEKEVPIDKEGFLYIYVANESPYDQSVWFDDFKVDVTKSKVTAVSDYYPFGMLQAGNSTNSGDPLGNKYLFQGQELQEDLGLEWYHFKWRMHDPSVGRFFSVDPLAEDYVYNSTYAFSENKVTNHIELEGLEAVRPPSQSYSRNRRAGGNFSAIRRTVEEASRIQRRPSGFATILPKQGTMFTRTTTYSTSRGGGNNSNRSSSGTNVGFEENLHTFGNTKGNVGKVLNDLRQYAEKIINNVDQIQEIESFTESGIVIKSLGTDLLVGDFQTTQKLNNLQNKYNGVVMEIARGDLSAEEFSKLDPLEQNIKIGVTIMVAGPSPYGLAQQKVQESERIETTREDESFIRSEY